MNLDQFVKDYGVTHKVTTTRYRRVETQNLLTPESKEDLENRVIKWFKDQGWTTKRKKQTRSAKLAGQKANGFVSRRGHTKIDWEIRNEWRVSTRTSLKKKTPNGGWADVSSWRVSGDLDKMVKLADSIPKPTMVSKETLPPPIKIGETADVEIDPGNRAVSRNNRWQRVIVDGVVGLEKDGTISESQVYDPNENPWFIAIAVSHDGASCYIITDGEILHPLNVRTTRTRGQKRARKMRVTSNVPWVVKGTTKADKELLSLAIQTLFQNQNE